MLFVLFNKNTINSSNIINNNINSTINNIYKKRNNIELDYGTIIIKCTNKEYRKLIKYIKLKKIEG